MSKTSLITVRIEPKVKTEAERLYSSFGLNISDAINMFIHQSLLVGGLPFELKNPGFKGEFNFDDGSSKEETVELSIDELKKIVEPIAKKNGVKSLYLIGSRARGDNRPDSDYDFCYEFEDPSLMKTSALMYDLSEALNSKVDLISRKTKKSFLVEGLERDGVAIYEE